MTRTCSGCGKKTEGAWRLGEGERPLCAIPLCAACVERAVGVPLTTALEPPRGQHRERSTKAKDMSRVKNVP